VFAQVVGDLRLGIVFPLFYFWIAVLLWMLFRKRILGLIAAFPLIFLTQSQAATHWVDWVFNAIIALVFILVLDKLGLFVSMVYLSALDVITHDLLTADLTSWYGLSSMISIAVLAVLALVAFRMSLGARDLFGSNAG